MTKKLSIIWEGLTNIKLCVHDDDAVIQKQIWVQSAASMYSEEKFMKFKNQMQLVHEDHIPIMGWLVCLSDSL